MSPRATARVAGAFYLLNIITGALAASFIGVLGATATIAAAFCYAVVTVLFYVLFKRVNQTVALIASVISLAGCVLSVVGVFHTVPINNLVLFGFYCLLIGYLIVRSRFLPRIVGVLMMIAGLGWLTFTSPSLAHMLAPYNFAPGVIGEGALTLWLLAFGVRPHSQTQAA